MSTKEILIRYSNSSRARGKGGITPGGNINKDDFLANQNGGLGNRTSASLLGTTADRRAHMGSRGIRRRRNGTRSRNRVEPSLYRSPWSTRMTSRGNFRQFIGSVAGSWLANTSMPFATPRRRNIGVTNRGLMTQPSPRQTVRQWVAHGPSEAGR